LRIELLGLDAAGGKAIVRRADRWYLLLRSRAWRPIDIGGEERALSWRSALPVTPFRRSFESFDEVIDSVRRLCGGEADRRGGDGAEPAAGPWEQKLEEIIHRFSGLLDRTFAARGCSSEESLQLSLEALRWLREMGPVEDEDVPWLLYWLAREVYFVAHREPGEGSEEGLVSPAEGVGALGETRLRKALSSLDRRTLQCLILWQDQSLEEMQTLLRISPLDVQSRLALAALRLGVTINALRDPVLLETCRSVLQELSD